METLTCLAVWSEEGAERRDFMLGRVRHKVDKMNNRVRLEDQVRCFLYREKPGGGAKGGFRVAQSGSASCSGLQRPSTDGVRQINIKPGIL